MGVSRSSSSESDSRRSSTSHLHLAAFQVRLAGGEAAAVGEGTSCGIEDDFCTGPGTGCGCKGPSAVAVGVLLRRCRRRRPSAGAEVSGGGSLKRQEIRTS